MRTGFIVAAALAFLSVPLVLALALERAERNRAIVNYPPPVRAGTLHREVWK